MSSKLLICSLFALLLSARNAPLQEYESVEPHMGTLYRIELYATTPELADKGFKLAFARIAELDNKLSDYKPGSELNLATAAAVSNPVRISRDLATVLEASQVLSVATGGAFDVTVGPLTRLWRAARKQGHAPTPEAIAQARIRCGFTHLHLDAAAQSLKVDVPGMQLDLGAIAKGYAADEAVLVLGDLGIHSALVAASGDLAFSDAPPGQPGWKIGIDSFDAADKPFTRILMLKNAAVSTSGAEEQHLDAGGKRYSHIIDPTTGMGLETDLTVTTIARHGLQADPAATAVSVLGCDRGIAFIDRYPQLGALVLEKRDGQIRTIESSSFKSLVSKDGYGSN